MDSKNLSNQCWVSSKPLTMEESSMPIQRTPPSELRKAAMYFITIGVMLLFMMSLKFLNQWCLSSIMGNFSPNQKQVQAVYQFSSGILLALSRLEIIDAFLTSVTGLGGITSSLGFTTIFACIFFMFALISSISLRQIFSMSLGFSSKAISSLAPYTSCSSLFAGTMGRLRQMRSEDTSSFSCKYGQQTFGQGFGHSSPPQQLRLNRYLHAGVLQFLGWKRYSTKLEHISVLQKSSTQASLQMISTLLQEKGFLRRSNLV